MGVDVRIIRFLISLCSADWTVGRSDLLTSSVAVLEDQSCESDDGCYYPFRFYLQSRIWVSLTLRFVYSKLGGVAAYL